MIDLFFSLVHVFQPIIKTHFLADGSNMARCSFVPSTFDPLFFRAGPFSDKTGETFAMLANSEYPDRYSENPYWRFHNLNLIRGGRK